MTTLSADIDAYDATILVDDGSGIERGQWFQLDDELIEFINYGQVDVGRADWAQDTGMLLVRRGRAGTTAVSHLSGVTLTPYYPDAPSEGGAVLPDGWTWDENGVLHAALFGGEVRIDPAGSFELLVEGGTRFRVSGLGLLQLYDSSDQLLLYYDENDSFTVCAPAGDPALRVALDGSVHIKTGTSILADL